MVGFSLTQGGFLHTVFRHVRLARGDEHDPRRQAAALVILGWVPLVALAGLEILRGQAPVPLVAHYSVHVRALLAVPLFIFGEHVLGRTCGWAFERNVRGRLAAEGEVERIARSATRLRDAWWPELSLLALALGIGQLVLWSSDAGPGLITERSITEARFSLPRVWYSLVSLPLFQFLLARAIWHWFIWTRVLWQLSRLELRLVPTHPDRAGGIALLATPSAALALVVLALSGVLAAAWADQLLAKQVTLSELAPVFVLFTLLAEVVALGPPLFFFGQLARTRHRGLREYGELALRYTRSFHAKWVDPGIDSSQPREELLGTSDIQSLADLANSFAVVQHMRVAPFGRRVPLLLSLAALAPVLPLIALERSIGDIVLSIGRAVLGGAP